MAKSYYKTIKGKKYDRELLEQAEGYSKENASGKLNVNNSKDLMKSAMDGNIYTEIEQDTIEYILENLDFTDAARKKLQSLHNKNKTPSKKEAPQKASSPKKTGKPETETKSSTPTPTPSISKSDSIDREKLKEELYTEILFEIKKDIRDEIKQTSIQERNELKNEIISSLPEPSKPVLPIEKIKAELKDELKKELRLELLESFKRQTNFQEESGDHSHRWIYLSIFAVFLFVLFHWLYLLCGQPKTQVKTPPIQNQEITNPDSINSKGLSKSPKETLNTIKDSSTTPPKENNKNSDKDTIESIQIKFAKNSYKVTGEKSYESVKTISRILKENKSWRIRITGHTCNLGTSEFNQKISLFRANSLGNYLKNSGIQPDRIETLGKGDTSPVFDNSTPEGREKNRRVEFKILEN